MCIRDSIGCSGGRAFDENKSEFAQPLYWLTKNNGDLFPATTILIVHHANKNGGFRGTSAIRDAVDETWALRKPTDEEKGRVGGHSRLITIEKSRSGRMDTQLVMQMQDDLSFTISDFTPEVDENNTSPASVADRVLQKLRVVHPESRTIEDLFYDPLINGKTAAIRKSLQRLEKRGLVVSTASDKSRSKQQVNSYKAILARGEGTKVSQPGVDASAGAVSEVGHKAGTPLSCPNLSEGSVVVDIGADELGHI